MAAQWQEDALGNVVDLFPAELGNSEVSEQLRKLANSLDALLFLDASGELMADGDAMRTFLQSWIPPDQQEVVLSRTEAQLRSKLSNLGQGQRVGWREAAKYGLPMQPESAATLGDWGLGSSTSVDAARRILSERVPAIPSFWLEADAATVAGTMVRALAHNRTVWDCVVAHLGYWAALGIFAVAGAFLIVGTATGPWGIPLAIWLIGVIGGGSAAIVLNCVANPNWI
ncbi:MAG TPA: hypothetical protein PK413_10980 [Thermoanaerobaculia bacterium]|nr:hypothetical protein [Thermoanaerobaculia bacterium]